MTLLYPQLLCIHSDRIIDFQLGLAAERFPFLWPADLPRHTVCSVPQVYSNRTVQPMLWPHRITTAASKFLFAMCNAVHSDRYRNCLSAKLCGQTLYRFLGLPTARVSRCDGLPHNPQLSSCVALDR